MKNLAMQIVHILIFQEIDEYKLSGYFIDFLIYLLQALFFIFLFKQFKAIVYFMYTSTV